jgi:hypothetical protein
MKKLALIAALLLAACGSEGLPNEDDTSPTGRTGGTMFPIHFPDPAPLKVSPGYNGIYYHGGPVLLGTVNVYYIWYGNWPNQGSPGSGSYILENLAMNIGGSPYFNINTTYFDSANHHITNSVHFGGATTDNYSRGASLNDASVASIVSTALANNSLPTDTNGVYFVLTSADVNETSGFCTHYCGWHTRGTLNGKDIKYSFVGDASRCPGSCEPQGVSPNGNAGVDGMASVVSHELEETATDPDLNAWYDRRGEENADKCAWTFGTTYAASNGSSANMKFGSMDYLIQRNWVNANGGYCALSY